MQMDPIETIDISGDSTFALMLEAQARGHKLFYYLPRALALEDGTLTAHGQDVSLRDESGNHATLGKRRRVDLGTFDVVHDAPGSALRHELHHHHAYAGAHSSQDVGGERSRSKCATRRKSSFCCAIPI